MKYKWRNFKGLKDFNIYYQCWLPEKKAKVVLLIAHGFAEHSGRYGNVVNHFVPPGYAVYALNHQGHVRSDCERVCVDDFNEYIKDLKTFFNIVRKENPRDKTLKLYDGLLHEIFNEPEHPQVMANLEAWLKAHL